MKNFIKMTLAVITGVLVLWVIGIFLFAGAIGTLASLGSEETEVPSEGVLFMDFGAFKITEQGNETADIQSLVSGGEILSNVGLWNAVRAIDKAANDPGIKFILIKPDSYAGDMNMIEELRQALKKFRKSGKSVISYLEFPSTSSYWIASLSDKVYMSSNTGSSCMITGVGSQMFFLKDLLDKVGVNVQLIRHGKYKSAGEMFIRNSPSKENLEQYQAMVSSLWESISEEIASDREMTAKELSELVDNLELCLPEDLLEHKLVDGLLTKEELKEKVAILAGKEKYDDVALIPFADYAKANISFNIKAKKKIAVIYAEGDIVEGNGSTDLAGDRYASIIAKVRADSSIKAVVLRVASPGGSVLASDKIKTEIDLLRAEKTVYASYGNYAASGGYWISNSCDKIFTDKTTLTGSIGVFSMVPDFSKTAKDLLHVGITCIGSSPHSDMYSGLRPLSDKEAAFMQKGVEDVYENFVNTVAQGRDLRPSYVDSIAQGRVWAGAEGIKIGLCDEIGTLSDAIETIAADCGDANLANWRIEAFPKPMTTMESIMAMFNNSAMKPEILAGTPFADIETAFKGWKYTPGNCYAMMPYRFVIR